MPIRATRNRRILPFQRKIGTDTQKICGGKATVRAINSRTIANGGRISITNPRGDGEGDQRWNRDRERRRIRNHNSAVIAIPPQSNRNIRDRDSVAIGSQRPRSQFYHN